MKDQLFESLSAMMDGEADELEVQRVLARLDDEVIQKWWAYHTISSLASRQSSFASIDVSAQVAEKIRANSKDDECESTETELSGSAIESGQISLDQPKASIRPDHKGKMYLRDLSVLKRVGLVASLVFAFVLGHYITVETMPEGISYDQVAQRHERPLQGLDHDGLLSQVSVPKLTPAQQNALNLYLLKHAENSVVGGGATGFVPLARVASVNAVGI